MKNNSNDQRSNLESNWQNSRQKSPKSVIGPEGFDAYIAPTEFCSYEGFQVDKSQSLWVLHRGMAEQWPQLIKLKLLLGDFKLLESNEVFTIVRPLKTKHIRKNYSNSDKDFYLKLENLGGQLQTSPPAKTSESLPVNRYEIDRLVSTLADVSGWEAKNRPNTSSSGELLRDLRLIKSNIKALAWKLEKIDGPPSLNFENLSQALSLASEKFEPRSKICTSADIYSDWHRALSAILRSKNYKLRKIWEWTFTIKAFYSMGYLNSNSKGLGFGCGTEPLASCFANYVKRLLITDAPPEIIDGKGWSDTSQHTSSLEDAKHSWLAPREAMDQVMEFDYVDMNNIPNNLHDSFDFVWSSCALEHLGSKELGLIFICESLRCLKPGGIAIHTTEFDLSGQCPIDEWETVLFTEHDLTTTLQAKIKELESLYPGKRFELVSPDFKRGNSFIDGYVDIPPYSYHPNLNSSFEPIRDTTVCNSQSGSDYPYPQINLSVDGYPSTSVALICRRIE